MGTSRLYWCDLFQTFTSEWDESLISLYWLWKKSRQVHEFGMSTQRICLQWTRYVKQIWKRHAIFWYVTQDLSLKQRIFNFFFILSTMKNFIWKTVIHIPGRYIKAVHKEGIMGWSGERRDYCVRGHWRSLYCLVSKRQPKRKYDCLL